MRKRILTATALALLLTFGYVPERAPLSEYVGASAVVAEQCSKHLMCGWVKLVFFNFEFCVERENCPAA